MGSKKGSSSVVLPGVFLGLALLLVVAEARDCVFCKDMPGISSGSGAVLLKKTTIMASCYLQCLPYMHYPYVYASCMNQCHPGAGIVGVLEDAKQMRKMKQQQQEKARGGGFEVLAMPTEHAGRE
ncbi:uncharacterized protein LOC123420452 isoform X2 [Hordeum vulgare subsp. vulgare]|uniref:uncharacterized protein LOC123406261 isoform X2 n=1 Tax=Hordeum vulgare subsp. vulgare TaxID=112509 RepID=UPI001D1A3EE5|nr:uncharacterized protein LOC123406261 isoform X2 [Hordeum vulgare subsp. vulgare]XP_044963288.1 uncharacterized protein LOC123420450 isoform X2 [Hordeum vulgare subsp. vulgare]XP_044963291.1 uncharacterized protein LOC123420452 isoform X2 [Hordeum vulgare subsp. vulgare]